MAIKPQKTITKKTIQQKIQKLGAEWGDDPKKVLAKLKKLTKEYEAEITKKEVDQIFKGNKRYEIEDRRDAARWFRSEVQRLIKDPFEVQHKEMNRYTRRQPVMSMPKPTDIGKMFFYKYDPKHKETLPYYDIFPLILMVKPLEDGWQGLNLHYLPPKQREILIYRLMVTLSDTRLDNHTRLKINYDLLKGVSKFRYFEPCFKRYLVDHVKSNVRPIPIRHWAKAILLPVAKFKKASITTVWADSRRKMQRK